MSNEKMLGEPLDVQITRLRAELAEARSERQREHDLRVQFAGEIEGLRDRVDRARIIIDELWPDFERNATGDEIKAMDKRAVAVWDGMPE